SVSSRELSRIQREVLVLRDELAALSKYQDSGSALFSLCWHRIDKRLKQTQEKIHRDFKKSLEEDEQQAKMKMQVQQGAPSSSLSSSWKNMINYEENQTVTTSSRTSSHDKSRTSGRFQFPKLADDELQRTEKALKQIVDS
ncbi:unnamed protein product, partial [Amoebophrya sp. A25]